MISQQEAIRRALECEREIDALKQSIYIPPDPDFEKEVRAEIKRLSAKKPLTDETMNAIETLRLSLKKKKVAPEIESDIWQQINALQKESNELWEYAKSLNHPKDVKKNYENLANAVCKQAVLDYEALISGTKVGDNNCNLQELIAFANNNLLTDVDLYAIFQKIARVRSKEFVPYCASHKSDILDEYREYKKKKIDTVGYNAMFPYRCKVCGSALKPKFNNKIFVGIGCVGCKMYVYATEMVDHLVEHAALV